MISLLEGVITFISPCLLPMLPVYLSYFAGGEAERGAALRNALGFIVGFTLVFTAMGAFAGSIGTLLRRYQTALNLVTGAVVIAFGLAHLGLFQLRVFRGASAAPQRKRGFAASALFGMVFSIGWTPCVGAFLGSALMLASQQGSAAQGILMLLCYSLGLGIPFFISALLIDHLKRAFDLIKRHYRVINAVSGGLLVLIGILMMIGVFGQWMALLSV